ncbi:MAG: VanZ family protein [Myxococcota bacterium]
MSRLLRALAALAAAGSTLFTLFVTHLPAPSAVGVSETDPDRVAVRGVWHTLGEIARRLPDAPAFVDPLLSDETLHFLLFLPPAVFGALAFGRRLTGARAVALFLALAAWAALDEASQHLTGRDGQWGDWLADTAGAATGILLTRPLLRRRAATRSPAPSASGSAPPAGGPAA